MNRLRLILSIARALELLFNSNLTSVFWCQLVYSLRLTFNSEDEEERKLI